VEKLVRLRQLLLMAVLWGVLDRIIAGPFLMLLLQATLFLAGSYLVLRRALPPRTAALAASLLLLFPPVLTPMAYIWKDSLMAGCCCWASASLSRSVAAPGSWGSRASRSRRPSSTTPSPRRSRWCCCYSPGARARPGSDI
jgi:hypothetical protein